jgi:hypothetical protein
LSLGPLYHPSFTSKARGGQNSVITGGQFSVVIFNRTRSGGNRSILFGKLPPNVIGVCGAGPGEQLSDAFIGGNYGSPFAYHFLRALQNPNADIDENNRVSIQEAVQTAQLALKSSGERTQNPTIDGADADFSFLEFSDAQPKSAFEGELYALLIAINEYDNSSIRLRGCVNDARAFHAFLLSHGLAESVEMLLDADATGERIKQSLSKLLTIATENDVVVVFYSCHLVDLPLDEKGDTTAKAICPVDLQVGQLEDQGLLQVQQVCTMLDKAKAKQKIVLIP